MVEIGCPEDPTWKSITVQYTDKEIIELRLVSDKGPTGNRVNVPAAGQARCIAHLLLGGGGTPDRGKDL